MAKLRVTGKHYTRNGIVGISLIVVAVVAVVALILGFVILPNYAQVDDYKSPEVIGISMPDDAMISVNADLTTVYAIVRYDNGDTKKVPLSELIYDGLDVSKEGVCKDVILDYGGFIQKVDFNVVPTTLSVEYVAGTGGRIDGSDTQQVVAGGNADTVRAIADEGYYFVRWSDGVTEAIRTDKQVSKNIYLMAVFQKQSFTVVFYYPDGTTAREESVLYNEAPTRVPTESEREMDLYGYKFVEWDTDYTHITQDTSIHPIYEKYAVDFHLDITADAAGELLGGAGGTDINDYYEKEVEAEVRIKENESRIFTGWYVLDTEGNWVFVPPISGSIKNITVGNGTDVWFSSSYISDSDNYVLTFTPPKEGVEELYVKAHFVFEESKITFTSSLGTVGVTDESDQILVKYGETIGEYYDVEDLGALSAKGYTFKGWYVENGAVDADGNPVFLTNDATFEQDTTIVAYWEKNVNTVVFLKGENEDITFTDVTAGYDDNYKGRVVKVHYLDTLADAVEYGYPEEVPVKENYTFKGWYLADAYLVATAKAVDRSFVVENDVVYVVPVFEVNTRTLTVSVTGSGTAYKISRLSEADGSIYEKETSIASVTSMPVTEDFTVRFRPGTGYTLVSVTVNGVKSTGALAKEDGYYDVLIESVIATDYIVKAEFSLDVHEVAVTNGTESKSGMIAYNVIGAPDADKRYFTETTATLPVNHGSGLYLEITPPAKNSIADVRVNGVSQKDIPADAQYYVVAVENCTSDVVVTVTYEVMEFVVELPEDGGMTDADNSTQSSRYTMGDSPVFTVTAETGYYIKVVRANGMRIDPYTVRDGYAVSGIYVNGSPVNDSTRGDYRITQLKLTIDGISEDTVFTVEYAKLYYKITTSYTGVGTVSSSTTVEYGSPATILAETSDGYYVASYTVDSSLVNVDGKPVTYSYTDKGTSKAYNIRSVKADYDISFVFTRTTYYVTFDGTDSNVKVTYAGMTDSVAGRTFSGISSNDNVKFALSALEGYRISEVIVESIGGGVTENHAIGFDTTDYEITINNIADNYLITVSSVVRMIDYTVHFLNPEASSKNSVNNAEVTSDIVNGTAVYGQPFSVTVIPEDGYSVDIDTMTVKPKDRTSEYTYKTFDGEYVENSAYGQYTLISEGENASSGYTLNVRGVKTSIDVYVYLVPKPTVSTSYKLELNSSGNGELTSDPSDATVPSGSRVTLTAVPDSGYSLEALTVNGKTVVADANGKYVLESVTENTYVYAVFTETTYTVRAQQSVNGVVSINKTLVNKGAEISVRLTPATGYSVSEFTLTIGSRKVILSESVYSKSDVVEYTIGANGIADEYVDGNVTVTAKFTAKTYTYKVTANDGGSVSGLGETGEATRSYGELVSLQITSTDGYYISSVTVNGIGYAPSALANAQLYADGSNNVKSGNLDLSVTEETEIYVEFAPKVYSVTIADSLGGTTLVRKTDGAFSSADEVALSAGDKVEVKMRADTGYHISGLYVNGVENTAWRIGGINENAISEDIVKIVDYVNSNVTVRVIYALNEYEIKVNISNKSLNFSSYDQDPSSYGTVTLTGYTAGADNVYSGIGHGSNVKFVLSPRTGKGYYISRFDIVYVDPETGAQTTDNCLTKVSSEGGSYIVKELGYDIQAVNVEFKRKTFSYTQNITVESKGSSFACEGKNSTEVSFTNPYDTSATVILDNNRYEYGLTYRINVDPKTGYTRTAFTINGEDRSQSVRASSYYTSTVSSDIAMAVTYEINTYRVSMNGTQGGSISITDDNGIAVWDGGVYAENTYSTDSGTVWVTEEGIFATHGTTLKFVATPSGTTGYKITSFYVNGSARAITNEDAEMAVSVAITEETPVNVSFDIHVYRVSIESFSGGIAKVSSANVNFDGEVTISLSVNKGYVLNDVRINGTSSAEALSAFIGGASSYTVRAIRENMTVVFDIETKRYDVTFAGDYNAVKTITRADGEKQFTAVSGVIVNRNSLSKTEWSAFTDEVGAFEDTGKLVNGVRYGDSLVISLTAPNGYSISAVTVSVDDDGAGQTDLVLGVSGLAADDGSGTRTYTLSSVPGNVRVFVSYAIKQYTVVYEQRTGGKYEEMIARYSHHELITLRMQSDDGYYLASLMVNGREISTEYTKNELFYSYTTDIEGKQLEINDEFVNGKQNIVVIATYEKQYYNVLFYVQSMPITGGYTDANLNVSLRNNRIIYDETGTDIAIELAAGYSLDGITLYSVPKAQAGKETSFSLTQLDDGTAGYNEYSPKSSYVRILLNKSIINILDFHSAAQNTIRIYISYKSDKYTSATSMYLVTSDIGETNLGGNVSSATEISITNSYSDGIAGTSHAYGTVATFTANIASKYANDYNFEGFQEKDANGEWRYIDENTEGITLMSDGRVISYVIESDREFRAVFFRVYTVTLEVHPEYKYIRGSFADGDPNSMLYRRYAIMYAQATYTTDTENGIILPNIEGTYESLSDTDGNSDDGTYTYRVRSGATVVFNYRDLYNTTNPTGSSSYYTLSYESNGQLKQNEVTSATITVTKDVDVRAYLKNKVYVSFLMETVGSLTANAGGTVTYEVNNAAVNSLKENSLTVNPNDSLKITIKPKTNYRFDSVMELVALSEPDSSGYRRYNTVYTPLEASKDGSVKITYYDSDNTPITDEITSNTTISKVEVLISSVTESSVYKIRFWKKVTLNRTIECVTDESTILPGYTLDYTSATDDDATSEAGQYDFGDTVTFAISSNIDGQDWFRYYQFVGYFVNGINMYTQLSQNYPSNDYDNKFAQSFTLDNLNGLADGVNIVEETSAQGITEYVVNVVARFIPVYNVVIENEYYDNDTYLDPGQAIVSAVMYDSELPTYYVNSAIADPRLGAEAEDARDVSFTMLGKLNSIESGNKNSSTSPYNVWKDNTITLSWSSTAGSGFKFVAWQYYAYDAETQTFEWRNIPYKDPSSQTNLVTKPTFTFPISSLFSTSYMAYVDGFGKVDDSFMFDASVYDANGERTGSIRIPAIRIRPLYQKVEKLVLVQSVATEEATLFGDGVGDIEPRIAGTGLSSGEFDYATVQTLLPSATSEYKFVGWYITENGAGGVKALDVTASASEYNEDDTDKKVVKITDRGITYYLKKVSIPNTSGDDTGEYIYCNYNRNSGELQVLIDGSYKIFARYTSVYTLNITVSNLSGYSAMLTETLPTINVYSGDTSIDSNAKPILSGERAYTLTDVPVGTSYWITLTTHYHENLNDATYFNPVFDRWAGATAVNVNGESVWETILNNTGTNVSGYSSYLDSGFDVSDSDKVKEYNDTVESLKIRVNATDNIDLSLNFRTYGMIVIHNVYRGSAVRLPQSLANALNGGGMSEDYFVKDGGDDDFDGVVNGSITIANIPITQGTTYDGSVEGDYACRLIDGTEPIANGNVSFGLNFDGSVVTNKIQHIVYYGECDYKVHEWVASGSTEALTEITYHGSSAYDYPFEDGGNENAGYGTANAPFKVATVEHLTNIENLYIGNDYDLTVNGKQIYFIQTADIDLGEIGNSLENALCANGNGFNGNYNGNGKTLYNLNISSTLDNLGLFAKTLQATIINVVLGRTTVSTSTGSNVGALIGYAEDTQISNVIFSDTGTVSKYIRGKNNVGGLVGYAKNTTMASITMDGYTVTALVGATYESEQYSGGGAGGIVGAMISSQVKDSSASEVMVTSPYGAGGIAGTIMSDGRGTANVAIDNTTATNVTLSASGHIAAIGGIAGAVGRNVTVQNSKFVLTRNVTASSQSIYGRFNVDATNAYKYGVGGITGYNAGTIDKCSVSASSSYKLTLKGTIAGGIAGVNVGTITDSTLSARLYISRAKGSSAYEGGMYGGIAGVNVGGTVSGNVDFAGADNYESASAFLEVVTLDKGGVDYYTPTSGNNSPMHEKVGSDNSNLCVGGIVGYNLSGDVTGWYTKTSKMMVNRRSDAKDANDAYIGGIVGYSTNDKISGNANIATQTLYVKYLHYMYVDVDGDPVAARLYMGSAAGQVDKAISGLNTIASALYVGGGTDYTPKTKGAFSDWGTSYDSGYGTGYATVKLNTAGGTFTADSYVSSDWNTSGVIKSAADETGKAYSSDCTEESINAGITKIWHYNGYLRYVSITYPEK